MVVYGINDDNYRHILVDSNELLPWVEEYYKSWQKV